MTNRAIASAFDELAGLMELHDEDEFRIRSYRNAYLALKKIDRPLDEMSDSELKSIKGVGAAIAAKIRDLVTKGRMETLERYRQLTPPGVVEMLEVNGFGPKKVRTVWKEMGIETPGELWYACNENRLVEVKGFGQKTQADLKTKLEFYLRSRHKLHLHAAEEDADFVCTWLQGKLPGARTAAVGELRRRMPVIDELDILVAYDGDLAPAFDGETLTLDKQTGTVYEAQLENNSNLRLHHCAPGEYAARLFELTGTPAFVEAFPAVDKTAESEEAIFQKAGLPYVVPELRETAASVELARNGELPELVRQEDLLGLLHVHTTWSDGLHSVREMAEYARNLGYQYIGITDHSQSAFYANGLKPDRVLQQFEEIEKLNAELAPFRIFRSIECDILHDGSLDYDEKLLAQFDFVIASVHAHLNMTQEKATERIVRAIENPYTTIIGHPTGRLLLSRQGYPLDWDAVFEACARRGVALELNANPYRLDIDYTLIPAARKHGILIAIDPDAHSTDGIHDNRYGVMIARKGGLTREGCVNTMGVGDFQGFIKK
jgi:DNA polymerase (family 10)